MGLTAGFDPALRSGTEEDVTLHGRIHRCYVQNQILRTQRAETAKIAEIVPYLLACDLQSGGSADR